MIPNLAFFFFLNFNTSVLLFRFFSAVILRLNIPVTVYYKDDITKLLMFVTKLLITHSNFIDVYLELKENKHTCT